MGDGLVTMEHHQEPDPQSSIPSTHKTSEVLFGAGLPPVPAKLVKRIEDGEFIEMIELLPERLAMSSVDDRLSKPKRRSIQNILEWVQCFGLYIAIISRKEPARVPDLLGYQALIIDASREYLGEGWMGYDRHFWQRAAATPTQQWAMVEPTLWNIAFAGRANPSRCKLCFSTTHLTTDCELVGDQQTSAQTTSSRPPRTPAFTKDSSFPRRRICFDWNETASPDCPRRNCIYEHICYLCDRDPSVQNKHHKAMYCPRRKSDNHSGFTPRQR